MGKLSEQQWWVKARRYHNWYSAFVAEMKSLYGSIDHHHDPAALQRIIARADAIEKRVTRLKLIMGRHWQRAPKVLARIPCQVSALVH
jgi:hypothetical protein